MCLLERRQSQGRDQAAQAKRGSVGEHEVEPFTLDHGLTLLWRASPIA